MVVGRGGAVRTPPVHDVGRLVPWYGDHGPLLALGLGDDNEPATAKALVRPFPVLSVGEPQDKHSRRGGSQVWPKSCRGVSVTRYGIKFISVDTQHRSNFGVGNHDLLKWKRRFRISKWWLHEDDYQQEFWDAFDCGDRFPFPHVQPGFPVIDVDNPDVVVFRLENPENPWMIEVDLRKKVLLAATACSKGSDGLSGDAETINIARVFHYDPIPSELPRYMDGGQAY